MLRIPSSAALWHAVHVHHKLERFAWCCDYHVSCCWYICSSSFGTIFLNLPGILQLAAVSANDMTSMTYVRNHQLSDTLCKLNFAGLVSDIARTVIEVKTLAFVSYLQAKQAYKACNNRTHSAVVKCPVWLQGTWGKKSWIFYRPAPGCLGWSLTGASALPS